MDSKIGNCLKMMLMCSEEGVHLNITDNGLFYDQ